VYNFNYDIMKQMFSLFYCLYFLINLQAQTPISVVSWNLENLGKSKTDSVIEFIANTVKDYDIVAIQEVVAGYGGSQAVAKLSDALNRKGTNWDYTISDPTSSDNSNKIERYAFIWKTNKLNKVGDAWLEKQYSIEIDREPFFATFKSTDNVFTLVTFHAITKAKQPETEIKYFKFLPAEYPNLNLILCGDFNCPQSHTVFNPLKTMGYKPIFTDQKTSLKQNCINNDCLASEFDNAFYNTSRVNLLKSGIINFHESFIDLKSARKVSDHVPIFFQFSLN
jgi:deoxyribonuclease-1-like protein